ncbi:putative exported protein [Candidatus Blochmanniella floridana]|uniref:Putative exported protein n=1 Tax=Blochmanniella floridana TaxID=203907 RepID=Q7VQN5_BLOFL|nr:putative exported protein [Candidatus Blochmannia floridanus]
MTCFRKFCLITFISLIVFCIFFVFLFGTNIGTYFIFIGIIKHIPGLTFDAVSGRWGNFCIVRIVYQIPSIGILKIDKCDVSIKLKDILNKQIFLEYIYLKNVTLYTKKINWINKRSENVKKSNNFFSNYSVIAKDIKLSNVHVISNDVQVQFQKWNTGLVFHNNSLKILSSYVSTGSVLFNSMLRNIVTRKMDTVISSKFWLKNASCIKHVLMDIINNKFISFLKYDNTMHFELSDIYGENFRICYGSLNNGYIVNCFNFQSSLNKSIVNVKLNINAPGVTFDVVGMISLFDDYPIHIVSNYIMYPVTQDPYIKPKEDFKKKITLIVTGLVMDELCIKCNFVSVESVINIVLKIQLMLSGIPMQLSIVGYEIPISLFKNVSRCLVKKMGIYITDEVRKYYIYVTSELFHEKCDPIHIFLYAHGEMNSCVVSECKINILNGCCKINGSINWNDLVHWNIICVFNNFDVYKKCLILYPIKLSGKIIACGHFSANAWEIMISHLNIHGNIKNNYMKYSGMICINSNGEWNIATDLLNNGVNILTVQGGMQKNHVFDIGLKFNIIDCSVFSPNLTGNVLGDCKLFGSVESPSILLKINLCSMSWKDKDVKINDILIDSVICTNGLDQSSILLKVNNIEYGSIMLNQLLIQGQGNFFEHYLKLTILGSELFGVLNIIGKFDLGNQIWNGIVKKTDIITPVGTWKIIDDVVLIYKNLFRKIILQPFSVEIPFFQFSVSIDFQKIFLEKLYAIFKDLNFISKDMKFIEKIMMSNVRICCTEFYWYCNNTLPEGSILFMGNKLDIIFLNKEEIIPINFNDVSLRVVLNQMDFFCNGIAQIYGNQFFVKFLISYISDIPKISGNICIDNVKLIPFLHVLLKSKKSIEGLLNINLKFYGDLYCPKIYGFVVVKYYVLNKPIDLLFIKDGVMKVNFFGDYALIDGVVNVMNGGRLYLDGRIINFNVIQNFKILLNIQGNQVDFYLSPTMYVKIFPKLTCTITVNTIDIQGDINVPYGYIKIKDFQRNIMGVSSEEIVLNDKFKPITNKPKNVGMLTISNLIIHIGSDVNFNGFGLDVKLKGDLEISYDENNLNITGQIQIPSGSCKIYSKNLMVQKGQVLFSGPINQVYLNVEAIQKINVVSCNMKDPVIAGIRIIGMVDKLKLEFFSNSAFLSQQEIASFLLDEYNLTLSNASDFDNKIASLLIGVGVNRYEKFINKIGNALGIRDLTVNTQGFESRSLIALSGCIAPGLQIRYGISIFDLLTTVTIRYCINSQLYLEATSGGYDQTLDLLYKFDF